MATRKKTLILVRHGEAAGYSSADAPLTSRGRMQALGVYDELERYGLAQSIQACVCSPLSRSLDTLQRICLGRLTLRSAESASLPGSCPVYVTDLARERLTTWGDTGRDASSLLNDSVLALDAPCFGPGLYRLSPRWWLPEELKLSMPATAMPTVSGTESPPLETPLEFQARVAALRRFLFSLPEDVILIVGHSVMFGALSRRAADMRHCQVKTVVLEE